MNLNKILLSILFSLGIIQMSHASEESKTEEVKNSIYCEDGSLCVPEGEPEPECD